MTEHGPVPIKTPRDRDGSFEPKVVRKRQRRFEGFDEKILALYSRGMSTRDIERYLRELYGVNVGRDLVSRVTDAVMDDARAWQQRPLDDVYPVVFLDCMVLKIREGGSVQRRRLLPRAGDPPGRRTRRARDVVSGDRGREVLDAGPGRAQAPRRLRHPDLLRRRAQRIPGGDRGDLPADTVVTDVHRSPHPPVDALRPSPRVRPGRQGPQADLHRDRRTTRPGPRSRPSTQKWGKRFPPITQAWQDAWEHVIPFLSFEPEVRRVIYTTDESVKGARSSWARSPRCLWRSGVVCVRGSLAGSGRRRNRVRTG